MRRIRLPDFTFLRPTLIGRLITALVKRTIEVTQSDIAHGVQHVPDKCPIARALYRTFPDAVEVGVNASLARVSFVDRTEWWSMPREAQRFIVDFDLGHHTAPLAFQSRLIARFTHDAREREIYANLKEQGHPRWL